MLPTCLSIQGLCELVDWWWNLQSLIKDGSLALKADVFWPFHKTTQISLGLYILTYKDMNVISVEATLFKDSIIPYFGSCSTSVCSDLKSSNFNLHFIIQVKKFIIHHCKQLVMSRTVKLAVHYWHMAMKCGLNILLSTIITRS